MRRPDAGRRAEGPTSSNTDANVRTVDASNPQAEAIAIEDGRITIVGSDDEAMAAAGADTEVVDLDDRSVLPGFHDVHLHAVEAGRFEEPANLPPARGVVLLCPQPQALRAPAARRGLGTADRARSFRT